MIHKFTNVKMANGLAFSHVQEIHARGSTATSFVYKFSTTMFRPFHCGLSKEFVDDHQPRTRRYPLGSQLFKNSE